MNKKTNQLWRSWRHGFLIGFFVLIFIISSLCVKTMFDINQFAKEGLNYSNLNMVSGQRIQLTPINPLEFPSNILSPMTWDSSNNSVVSIDNNGIATALTVGKTNITVIHFTGKIIGSCAIEVLTVGEYLIRNYLGTVYDQNISVGNSFLLKASVMTDFVEDVFGHQNEIEKMYYNDLARTDVTHLWGLGIQLMVLAQASSINITKYGTLLSLFINNTLLYYWDGSRLGYQPSFKPNLNDDDRYYDDNAWIGMGLLRAYEVTGNSEYLTKAYSIYQFLQEGQEMDVNSSLYGGIYWHISKKSINTCSSAPTAFFCYQLSQYLTGPEKNAVIQCANLSLDWCLRMMQDSSDFLFYDNLRVEDGHIDKTKYTYNTAMVIRSLILRYKLFNNSQDYDRAVNIANAADYFFDNDSQSYKGAIFFSYLLIKADLELFQLNQTLIRFSHRAQSTANYCWEKLSSPPHIVALQKSDIKTYAALASIFWMFA
jgi:hypothetical protein